MPTVTKMSHARSTKNLRKNGHHSYKKVPALTQKIKKFYSHSMKTVRRNPLQSAGAVLGLSVASSIYLWYRLYK